MRLRVHKKLEMKKKINYNVIAAMSGEEEPDRYVLVGKHRDAFFFRAAGTVHGSTLLMEVARVLGNLQKDGWKLRRTFKLWSRGSPGVRFNRLGRVG